MARNPQKLSVEQNLAYPSSLAPKNGCGQLNTLLRDSRYCPWQPVSTHLHPGNAPWHPGNAPWDPGNAPWDTGNTPWYLEYIQWIQENAPRHPDIQLYYHWIGPIPIQSSSRDVRVSVDLSIAINRPLCQNGWVSFFCHEIDYICIIFWNLKSGILYILISFNVLLLPLTKVENQIDWLPN